MTTKNSITELISFKELVENKFFKIPDYQRGYTWEEKQIEDLLKDIEYILPKEHKHYTGTIVIAKTDESDTYDIVDGQQRLTTLIILMQIIHNLFPSKFSELKTTFLKRDFKCILETNAETKNFFNQVIYRDKSDKADISSKVNIVNAKEKLNKWVNENKNRIEAIFQTVVNKLGFLCFAPENTDEIGIMFEVINNRGKKLSELEKIKNYFIYYSTIHNDIELKKKINERWGTILKHLNSAYIKSSDDENRFLRNCYLVFYSNNKTKSWYVYDELKEEYPPQKNENIEDKLSEISKFVDFIENAAKYYSCFYNPNQFREHYKTDFNDEFYQVLNHLRCHPVNASIFPLYLSAMSFMDEQPQRDAEILELLKLIEILNFRVYVLPNSKVSRADTHQGTLFFLANGSFNNRAWKSENEEEPEKTLLGNMIIGDIFDYLKMNIIDFTIDKCSEEAFVESLTVDNDESIDYYKWNGLRFFLASYEEYLKSEKKETWEIDKILVSLEESRKNNKNNDYFSREHIWASNKTGDKFPSDYKEKRRLGNFVLLGLSNNIQVGNEEIDRKVNFLKENFSKSMIQVNELEGFLKKAIKFLTGGKKVRKTKNYYEMIAKHLIDQRENKLIRFALKRWKFPNEIFNRFDKVDSFQAIEEKSNKNFYPQDFNKT